MIEKIKPKFHVPVTRIVLEDCRTALHQLRQEPAAAVWRIQWVGMLALLRTVRHVLTEVDGRSEDVHPKLREKIGGFLQRMKSNKPEPKIYWCFICEDANNILHYYGFSALQTIRRYGTNTTVTERVSAASTFEVSGPLESAVHIERVYEMKSGPFKGRDQRDVVEEAIEWWEKEIEEMIDRAAAANLGKQTAVEEK